MPILITAGIVLVTFVAIGFLRFGQALGLRAAIASEREYSEAARLGRLPDGVEPERPPEATLDELRAAWNAADLRRIGALGSDADKWVALLARQQERYGWGAALPPAQGHDHVRTEPRRVDFVLHTVAGDLGGRLSAKDGRWVLTGISPRELRGWTP